MRYVLAADDLLQRLLCYRKLDLAYCRAQKTLRFHGCEQGKQTPLELGGVPAYRKQGMNIMSKALQDVVIFANSAIAN